MPLTNREKKILADIEKWENYLRSYERNDIQKALSKYIDQSFSRLPEEVQKTFFDFLDTWLFHVHALIQSGDFQRKTEERILAAARVFHDNIHRIEDLKSLTIDQLQFIADQQIARHRFYSFIQGGAAGTGNVLFLGADLAAIMVINLRLVQLIAASYGYQVNKPLEMMISLKVFYASTLPVKFQKEAWDELFQDLQKTNNEFFYEGSDEITGKKWLEEPLKQVFKALAILLLKRKTLQGIPLAGMAIGAVMNERITKKVSGFAHKFYQRRFLLEKVKHDEYEGA